MFIVVYTQNVCVRGDRECYANKYIHCFVYMALLLSAYFICISLRLNTTLNPKCTLDIQTQYTYIAYNVGKFL